MSSSCDPIDYTVHGLLQARILEWVAFPFSRGSSQPRDRTQVSRNAGGFFTSWVTREAPKPPPFCSVKVKVTQSCPALCDPMDCSLPGSSVHGILQARILEPVALPSSRGPSWPRNQTPISCSSYSAGRFFTAEPPGNPFKLYTWGLNTTICLEIIKSWLWQYWAYLVAQLVKNMPAMWETWVRSLGWEDPLEKGMATHSSILA